MGRVGEFPVLAIDIGTSSTRAALFDDKARRLKDTSASQEYSLRYTADGGAELPPEVLLRAAKHCCARALAKNPVAAVGGSALWHGLLGLDRQSRPVTPVYTWADSRSAADARKLRERFSERRVHARSGCMLRATFWPAKLHWLKRTQPKLCRRVTAWVSPSDWIFGELFGTNGTSASMASATGLYNLAQQRWDEELCAACGVDIDQLSKVDNRPGGTLRGAPVFAAIGDGAASNLGSGADRPGIVAINVGTSAAVRTLSNAKPPFGLFRFAVDDKRRLIGGAVSNAGNLRQWCVRELKLDEKTVDRDLSRSAAAADSLTVLPFWVEERAPTWPEAQTGVIDGLKQSSTAAEIIRASATAVFYRLAQILELMESVTGRSREIVISGGILHSRAAVELLADALVRDVYLAEEREASLRGAAVYALNQLGLAVATATSRRTIRHNRRLALQHRERRQRQIDLEKQLTGRR